MSYVCSVTIADAYLAELVRYIHLNPVRAKIVKDPEKYLWNGHRSYMGRETLPWLTTEWVLSQFGRRLKRARIRYAEFVQYGIKDGHRHEFHKGTSGGRILGDDTFVDRVYRETEQTEKKTVPLDDIIESVGNLYGLTEEEIISGGKRRHPSEARGLIAFLVREVVGMSLTDLGRRMKRDISSLSLAADKIMRCSIDDGELGERKKILEKRLS